MNVLLISDIHSNFSALEAVIRDSSGQFEIEETWVLGDMVGYGPDPARCLELLGEIGVIAVAGNHDLATAGVMSTEYFNHMAAAAISWTRNELDKSFLDWLLSLPVSLERHGFTLVHGSPRDPAWEYVDSESVAHEALYAAEIRRIAVGHTHTPAIYELRGGITGRVQIDYSRAYSAKGCSFLVNPGSVGQPRDRDPRASYAVLDLDRETIYHRRVEYDVELTAGRIREAGLPAFLADRLLVGA